MAKFQPTTTIYFHENMGIDAANQPYFTSEAQKMGWYASKVKLAVAEYSYQRTDRQFVRVEGRQEIFRNCDALSFHNEEDKWIICDITYTDFINPNCTEIGFEVNFFQTYIEDIVWCDCWIEREMQSQDWAGGRPSFNNLVPEAIETGPIRAFTDDITKTFLSFDAVVLSAYDENAEVMSTPRVDARYITGLNQIVCKSASELGALLETYADKGKLDGISAIFMVPSEYSSPSATPWQDGPTSITVNFTNVGGYEPKNSKLFTGQFFYLGVSNRQGTEVKLALENFDNPATANYQFRYQGAFCGGAGGVCCYPLNYAGLENAVDYGVMLYNDVQCAYVGNAFNNWIANNRNSLLVSGIKDVSSAVGNIAGNMVTAVTPRAMKRAAYNPKAAMVERGADIVHSIAGAFGTAARILDQKADPAMMGGQINGSALSIALGTYGFLVSQNRPALDMVIRIDEYFSRFGYATNRMKKPNVDTRPFWNYVKTAGAIVKGPIPMTAKEEIQNIMNGGVTFWHIPKGAAIGDFSKDNRE